MQVQGKKIKTRNVVATLFYLFLYRTVSDAEPRYTLTMESCEVERKDAQRQIIVTDSNLGSEPFVFTVDSADLLDKWVCW